MQGKRPLTSVVSLSANAGLFLAVAAVLRGRCPWVDARYANLGSVGSLIETSVKEHYGVDASNGEHGGMIRNACSRISLEQTVIRFLNIGMAAVLLALTGPLLILTALLIYSESPGPVLDRQESLNRDGRRFQKLDFRVVEYDGSRRNWPGDITRVGSFLLFTRIVTLPQIINVARGDIQLTEMHDSSLWFWR